MVGGFKVIIAQAVERRVEPDAGGGHCVDSAAAAHLAGMAAGRPAQNGDAAVPVADQIGDGVKGGAAVVHAHHGQVGKVQLVGGHGGQHGGHAHRGKPLAEDIHVAAQKNNAFGLELPHDLFGGLQLVGIFVQVGDHAVVAVLGRAALQMHQQVGKEHIARAFYNKYNVAGLLDLELLRVGVGHKAHLPHDAQHLFLGLGADILPVIDHAGDRADRASAQPGNIFDRQCCVPPEDQQKNQIGNGIGNVTGECSIGNLPKKYKGQEESSYKVVLSRPYFCAKRHICGNVPARN